MLYLRNPEPPPRDFSLNWIKNQKITASSHDAGYQEYMVSPAEGVAAIPTTDLPAAEAARPLFCAGITVLNALRTSGPRRRFWAPSKHSAGLGHLGNPICTPMGFRTFASRPEIRQGRTLARKVGRRSLYDTHAGDPVAELQKFGRAPSF